MGLVRGGEVGLPKEEDEVEEVGEEEQELEVVSGESAGVTITSGGRRVLEQRGEWRQDARCFGSPSNFSKFIFSDFSLCISVLSLIFISSTDSDSVMSTMVFSFFLFLHLVAAILFLSRRRRRRSSSSSVRSLCSSLIYLVSSRIDSGDSTPAACSLVRICSLRPSLMSADFVASTVLTGEGRSGVEGGDAPARGPPIPEVPGDPPTRPPPTPPLLGNPPQPDICSLMCRDVGSSLPRHMLVRGVTADSSPGLLTSLMGLSSVPPSTCVWY